MDNYEINILRRGGNWKKVKPDDLIIDEINNELNHDDELNHLKSHDDFLFFVTKVDSIISRLEALESEKNKLKEELKMFENEFFKKRNLLKMKLIKFLKKKKWLRKH